MLARLVSPSVLVALLATLGTAAAAPPPSGATPTRTISVAELKPGMKGYGLTVFEGTRPDRFDVVVVGVLHNFLPKQDLILIRSDDPRLLHSGIVAGMSGSPIYVDGRLAGALSYGWSFSKDPLAGVTPIASMQAELKRPLRGREHTPVSEAANDPLFQPRRSLDDAIASNHGRHDGVFGSPLPPVPGNGAGDSRLVRASVPLSLAGFGGSAFAALSQALSPYHVTPLAAGGGAPANADELGPDHFEPGGSIAVNLVKGDMSMTGTGTVTAMDGTSVLAFGHPMFQLGEIYLPTSTAIIHTFMSALSQSFKMSTPLREVGSLVQDRQSCIVADTAQKSDMIPVRVRIGGPGREERTFEAEVVRHRFLTPLLASTVVANAAQEAASDVADATIAVHTTLGVRGFAPLDLTDHVFSTDGVSAKVFAASTGIKAIGDILFNPFEPAKLDRIDVQVDVDYRPDVAEITGVSLHTDEIEPGSRPSLVVTLRPYDGAEYSESIPVDIPASFAGETLKIEASAGNLVKPEVAPPESLRAQLDNLKKLYTARSIVITLQQPDEGLLLRGNVVPTLPASVMDTLKPGATTRRGEAYKLSARVVIPTRGVVVGKKELTVKVKEALVR